MTKYITVKLTREQANTIVNVFSDPNWVQDHENTQDKETKAHNAFLQRIANKILKALATS